jgi:hypothetical protein
VALSLGLPPPGVTWHRVFAEPGLSSLKKFKAISLLSGKGKLLLIKLISS